jgi:hypothetical protein
MAQSSFPFENIDTTETQYSQLFRTLNNGVNGTPDGGELEVDAAGAGLAVDIAAGQAMVRGHFYVSTETETRALATADSTNDRIDTVVLRLDPVANTILLAVKTGTPDPSPVAPALVQTDGGVFEQPLANVLVPANAGIPSTITDRREFMGTKLGTWTTDGRPTPAGRVLFGFNTTLEAVEFYDPINEVWGPVAPEINTLNDIGDVTITSATTGQVLEWSGSAWVNGQVDTAGIAPGAITTGLLPAGSVLQVVSTTKTDQFTMSGAYADITGLSATITPTSTSSKILVFYSVLVGNTGADSRTSTRLLRDSTPVSVATVGSADTAFFFTGITRNFTVGVLAGSFLDSPNSTASTVYKMQLTGDGTATVNRRGDSTTTGATSTITLMEIAG